MNLDQFITKWNGKGIDWDGSYGFQCVDLYRMYVKEVLGFPQSPSVPGAKDIWNTTLTNFTKIPNTPDGVPQKGDVMIWGASYGPYGHVAVVTEATVNTFKCFSQNDPVGSLPSIRWYKSYAGVTGWLRPKGGNLSDPKIEELQAEIIKKNEQISNLQNQVNGLLEDSKKKDIEVQAQKDKYTRDVQFLASKLQTTDDITVMGVEIDKLLVAEEARDKCLDDKRKCDERSEELSAEYYKTLEELSLASGVSVASSAGVKRALSAYLKLNPREIVGDIKDYENIIKLFGIVIMRR